MKPTENLRTGQQLNLSVTTHLWLSHVLFPRHMSLPQAVLGYTIGAKRIIAGMKEVLLPYHLDAFKQLAGRTALKYRSEMSQRVDYLKSQRDEVFIELSNLPVKTWQSGANFILFKPENSIPITGYQIWEMLVNDSILVRDCSSWENLNDCLRVTIGTEQENNSFIQSLKEILDI